jgi:Na+-driven multidrug efflux pump
MAIGSAIGIIVGKMLGAGEVARAKDTAKKMIAFSMAAATAIGVVLAGAAFVFPMIYNTSAAVKSLATYMMIIAAIAMPFSAFAFSVYFTLRSGGQVLVTIIFDSAFMWGVIIPVSAILAYLTAIPIHLLFAICQLVEFVKLGLGLYLLKKVNWARQLDVVSDT